jgi:hypothetical protein
MVRVDDRVSPPGEDPILLRIAEAVEDELFIDETRFNGLLLRTTHRIDRIDQARIRVVYRMEITGDGADGAGPEIGPGITALNSQGEHPNQLALARQAGTDVKMTSQVLRTLED